jgi:gamma-glutamyl:cysteine ligase YbdK (ATP-grasp superfamily)
MSKPLHLFEAFGIELEYMIVDKDTLEVQPVADELLKAMVGKYAGDFENGMVTWSNELVLHVIELKCTKPEKDLDQLEEAFHSNVMQINKELTRWNSMLLPTAAHPLMDPLKHTRLWPHDNGEVYAMYDKMFDCKGHGWSNLQSTHLNLPFNGDEEFGRLHAAIRVILPLLPALCASSPMLDGKMSGYQDTRMLYYRDNQKRIPSVTGMIVPEALFSEKDYEKHIYQQISKDIAPFDDDDILDPVWVNSRGAMARFDRGSIEIRVMDIQECPKADLAIQAFVIELLQALVDESQCTYEQQKNMDTAKLASMLDVISKDGMHAKVDYVEWLELFNISKACIALDIVGQLSGHRRISTFLENGNLATRISKSLSKHPVIDTWKALAGCLQNDTMFIP